MEKEEEKEEERGYGRKDVLPIVDGEGSSVSEVISSLIEGESVFQSYGTAKVKVGNKVKHLPIKSVDMEKIVKMPKGIK